MHNHRQFVGIGGVVGDAVGNQVGLDLAVAVFVLQAFAVERGASGGAAEHKAACAHIARRPSQVADALEAEHGIVDVKRNHRVFAVGVAGGRGNPRAHGTRLVNAFLQHLAVFGFFVEHQLVVVLRGVGLTFRVPDAVLAEHAFHAEGTAFVGHNRHDAFADLFVFEQGAQDAHKRHGGGEGTVAAVFELGVESVQCRDGQGLGVGLALGQVAT